MSDVEKFYESARKYFPNSPPWNRLDPFLQMQFVQGVSILIGVFQHEQ